MFAVVERTKHLLHELEGMRLRAYDDKTGLPVDPGAASLLRREQLIPQGVVDGARADPACTPGASTFVSSAIRIMVGLILMAHYSLHPGGSMQV